MSDFVNKVRKHDVKLNSAELVQECMATVRDEKGNINTHGKDLLIACAIAIRMWHFKPPRASAKTAEEVNAIDKEKSWQKKRQIRALKKRIRSRLK